MWPTKLGSVAASRDEFHFGITIRQAVHQSIHPGILQRRLGLVGQGVAKDPISVHYLAEIPSFPCHLCNPPDRC
jgi:hypothetical protein